MGLPWWLRGKESPCSAEAAGDLRSIPGSGRSPEEGNGNPLQYSCLENPMDREAWWATVHTITRSRTQWKPLSMQTHRTDTQLTLNNIGVGALTHQGVASMFVVPVSVALHPDSTNRRSCSTEVLTTEKNPHVSGPMQFKLVLIKGQLYCQHPEGCLAYRRSSIHICQMN